MNVLVIDIGGTSVKVVATGHREPRRMASGRKFTPEQMVEAVKQMTADWAYDVVSIGYPGHVRRDTPTSEPANLASGWVGFDYERALGRPVRMMNDAAMQALGSYEGGLMLFLGLGTGLGTAMIVDGQVRPLELGRFPYRKQTFEHYVGAKALRRSRKKWRRHVAEVVALFEVGFMPDYIVLGGGNVRALKTLPPLCRQGANANAFEGGFRMWASETTAVTETPSPVAVG